MLQEEHMKRDADCVLLEVNQKKSEARKHMTLINALQDLRNLRKNLQQNVAMTTEDDTAFNHATGGHHISNYPFFVTIVCIFSSSHPILILSL